jgi:hypothetical protein
MGWPAIVGQERGLAERAAACGCGHWEVEEEGEMETAAIAAVRCTLLAGSSLAALEAPWSMPPFFRRALAPALPIAFSSFGRLGMPEVKIRPQSGAEFIFNVIPARPNAVQGGAVLV